MTEHEKIIREVQDKHGLWVRHSQGIMVNMLTEMIGKERKEKEYYKKKLEEMENGNTCSTNQRMVSG